MCVLLPSRNCWYMTDMTSQGQFHLSMDSRLHKVLPIGCSIIMLDFCGLDLCLIFFFFKLKVCPTHLKFDSFSSKLSRIVFLVFSISLGVDILASVKTAL